MNGESLYKFVRKWVVLIAMLQAGIFQLLYAQVENKVSSEDLNHYLEKGKYHYNDRRYDSALYWLTLSLEASDEKEDALAQIKSHLLIAQIHASQESFSQVNHHLSNAKQLLANNWTFDTGDFWYECGYLHFLLSRPDATDSQLDSAIYYYNYAAQISKEEGNLPTLIKALNSVSPLLNTKNRQEEALGKSLEVYKITEGMEEMEEAQLEALNQIATIYFAIGEVDSVKYYFERLLAIRRMDGKEETRISDLQHFGTLFSLQGEYQNAHKYFQEGLDLAEASGDSMLMTGLIRDIGQNYLLQNNWRKTIEYANAGLNMADKLGFPQMKAVNYKHLGEAYQGLGELEEAHNHYQKALEVQEQYVNDPTEIAKLNIRIGNVLQSNANYGEALTYLSDALALKKKVNDKFSTLEIQLAIAEIKIKQGRFMQAINVLRESEVLSTQLNSMRGKASTYELLATAYASLGNFQQAFEYQQLRGIYKDSMLNEQNTKIVHELETRYQAERRNKENAQLSEQLVKNELTMEQDKAKLLEKKQQNVFLIVGIVGLSLVFLFRYYRNVKQQQLMDQKVVMLQKENEAQQLRSVITGEENERKRMARELHDGLGSLLASVKVMFNAVQNEKPEVIRSSHYQKAEHLLDQACQEVRQISHNMMPTILEQDGLSQAIGDLCEIMNQTNKVNITFIEHGLETSLKYDIQVYVYRIVQELVQNIIKHADAEEAIVQITVEEEMLQLTVEDDGKGFNMKESEGGGIGMDNIQSRVSFLKGNVEIQSAPGEGCSVFIEIPLN